MIDAVEHIIRETIKYHSYYLSDSCIEALVNNIKEHYAEEVEKAWMYDELAD